jgi:hypothetical protein
MRIALNIVGALLVPGGASWAPRGLNVIRFMTGQIPWLDIGGVTATAGVTRPGWEIAGAPDPRRPTGWRQPCAAHG